MTLRLRYIRWSMTSSKDIRDSFLRFFGERGHQVVPSGPLVPQNDPTLMFANAGMVPFKDVFTGKERREQTRAASSQKCIRISGKHNDLENVGVTARHHTFFEMLGNFSFGDYFKEQAIAYAWEYLRRELELDPSRMLVTVFAGEGDIPADTEAAQLWKSISGLPESRIVPCGAKDNFWSMGETGPCGPCSEIHYFFGDGEASLASFGDEPGEDGRGWVEIWNLVFMQFDRDASGRYGPLPAPSIDTGMGLERLSCICQGVLSNYDTDLLRPIVDLTAEIVGKTYSASLQPDDVSMRVIADHARTSAFLIAEGIFPDRDAREYVLRRVMRRAIRHAHRLGIERVFFHECALRVVDLMSSAYPELAERRALVEDVCQQEETRFRSTLRRGLERLSSYRAEHADSRELPGEVAFELYDTYGFPLDLQQVLGEEQGFAVDTDGFDAALRAARERSQGSQLGDREVQEVFRQLAEQVPQVEFLGYETELAESKVAALAANGELREELTSGCAGMLVTPQSPFYGESGGQVGDRGRIIGPAGIFEVHDTQKPIDGLLVHRGKVTQGRIAIRDRVTLEVDEDARAATRRNHSATHLLHLALRQVVGPQAMQKGSLVGPERLRFDYSASQPLTQAQIDEIEGLVNARILANVEVTTEVLPMDAAKERGAIGIFEEKYGEVVRMLQIADSLELCGGTHVSRTGDIGLFKLLSDAGIAAGVRRIEGATGKNALTYVRTLQQELRDIAEQVKGAPAQAAEKVTKLVEQRRELQREIDKLKQQLIRGGTGDLTSEARKVGDISVLGAQVDVSDSKALRELADQLRDKLAPAVVALGAATPEGKAVLVCTVSKELTRTHKAGNLIKELAGIVGGGGGGRPDFAQAGGSDPSKLAQAMERLYTLVS